MDLNQNLQCVRPVIFGYDDPELPDFNEPYPYWLKGTCFLVAIQRTTFVVTARHVLQNQAPPSSDATSLNNNLRILTDVGSRDFIPLDRGILMEGNECFKDLSVFCVATEIMDHAQRQRMAVAQFEIPSLTANPTRLLRPHASLVTRGYPVQFNYIDYCEERIKFSSADIHVRLKGCNSTQHLYDIAWDPRDIHRIEREGGDNYSFDPDGMSGSPVFAQSGHLVGVLVMGDRYRGRFISANVLYTVIRKFLLGKARNTV